MNKYTIFILLFTLLACSENNEKKESFPEGNALKQLITDKLTYTLIRDNLYRDDEGNLYLKAENKEDIDHGTTHNVWLKTVYCDSCQTPTEEGWKDITELKDVVDVHTFHYDTSYANEGVVMYADTKYSYRHKLMTDGGTITVVAK